MIVWGKHKEAVETAARSETDKCVLWEGRCSRSGTPVVGIGKRTRSVRRLVCEAVYGLPEDPSRADAKCTCGTPACINPRHLKWVAGGTARRVLTDADRETLLTAFREGRMQRPLALKLGVSEAAISAFKRKCRKEGRL